MSLLFHLSEKEYWERFFDYRALLADDRRALERLRSFIDEEAYIPVCETILSGKEFPLPERKVISKLSSAKKRIVYTYPYAENMTLKLLTWMVLRKYDSLFPSNLFSFRPQKNAKDAVRYLRSVPYLSEKYSYKLDVSDYFNSIPVEMIAEMISTAVSDDPLLGRFMISLLKEEKCFSQGKVVVEKKGIMAGTPLSSFFANLYLSDMDRQFADEGATYIRYSDDIIVFADSENKIDEYEKRIKDFIAQKQLLVNENKEFRTLPGGDFSFLGFEFRGETIDVSPVTIKKLKGKMKRKARSLARWCERNDIETENGAKAFIRIFNRKLFEAPAGNELSWSRWFFSIINTDESLREIDEYAQNLLRTLISGTNSKARFNIRYSYLKKLGYKSLVSEYFKYKKKTDGRD